MTGVDNKIVLSRREREIAIEAISARLSGPPATAARDLLAGIAVLDGGHAPILVWPVDSTREDKTAWHESEAAYWRKSAENLAEFTARASRNAADTPPLSPGDRSTGELVEPPARSTSSAAVHHEAGTQSPLHPGSAERTARSSDAC